MSTLQVPVTDADYIEGDPDAPVTLVEYADYECPYCGVAYSVIKRVQKHFGKRLRFVFRNFPLAESHPEAMHAAEAAESVAAHAGDKAFWKMHDLLFEHQQDDLDALDDSHLAHYGAEAGADAEQIKRDLDGDVFEARVRADFMSGARSGVNGTPTFFINGVRYDGDWGTVSTFAADIESAIGT